MEKDVVTLVDLLLTGNCHSPLESVLEKLLSQASSVGINLPGKYHHPVQCDYMLTRLDTHRQIESQQALWLIDHPSPQLPALSVGGNIIAVVCSHDQTGLRLAANSGVPTVTCGLCPRDTVTLSSITSDSAQVCLQRSLITLTGDEAEPTEYPLRLSGKLSQDSILMISAVLILCGETNLLQNAVF